MSGLSNYWDTNLYFVFHSTDMRACAQCGVMFMGDTAKNREGFFFHTKCAWALRNKPQSDDLRQIVREEVERYMNRDGIQIMASFNQGTPGPS